MRDNMKEVQKFLVRLEKHAERKSRLYDGADKPMGIDEALRYATEELGEVATAITRSRLSSVKDECFDLAHCAILIYLAVMRLERDIENG